MTRKGSELIARDLDHMTSWEGSAEELADIAKSLLQACGVLDEGDDLTVRLIRDYVSRNILRRPDRRGKEAVYSYRNLLEVVAARVLVADGWPLAKIAEHFAFSSDEDLIALIPGQEGGNQALKLARSFIAREPKAADSTRAMRRGAQASQSSLETRMSFRERAARVTSLQTELREAMDRLGLPPDKPPMEQVTLIAVAPWCQLIIETARLKTLTAEDAEVIGRAITASLLSPSLRKEIQK